MSTFTDDVRVSAESAGNRPLSFFRQTIKIAPLGFQKALAYKTFNRVEDFLSLSRFVSARLKKCVQI
jgi:hypothetical protein